MADFHQNNDIQYGFDIASFRAIVAQAGILKPTKWMFSTTVPAGLNSSFATNAARNIQYWASSATVPGATLVTHDTMRYGYGVAVKRPYSPAFGPMQLGFMSDGLGASWTFFKQWINLIINFDNSQGITSSGSFVNGNARRVYEVAYADDYTVDCVVSAFVDSGEEILRIVLRDAYPLAVSDMRMDWGDNSGVARFNVSMFFTDWYQVVLPMQEALGANQ